MYKKSKTDLKEVGTRIRNARKGQSLTQEAVAERAGITSQFVSRIETGHMGASVDTYRRIASALELTADNLLYGSATNIRNLCFSQWLFINIRGYIVYIFTAPLLKAHDTVADRGQYMDTM